MAMGHANSPNQQLHKKKWCLCNICSTPRADDARTRFAWLGKWHLMGGSAVGHGKCTRNVRRNGQGQGGLVCRQFMHNLNYLPWTCQFKKNWGKLNKRQKTEREGNVYDVLNFEQFHFSQILQTKIGNINGTERGLKIYIMVHMLPVENIVQSIASIPTWQWIPNEAAELKVYPMPKDLRPGIKCFVVG